MVGVELVDLGMNFDNCGNFCAPASVLLFYLDIDVELLQEGLETTLVFDG